MPYLILKFLNLNEIINGMGIGIISISLNSLPKEIIFFIISYNFLYMDKKI